MSDKIYIKISVARDARISDVAFDAVRIGRQLEANVMFEFDGISMVAFLGTTPKAVEAEYRELKKAKEGRKA